MAQTDKHQWVTPPAVVRASGEVLRTSPTWTSVNYLGPNPQKGSPSPKCILLFKCEVNTSIIKIYNNKMVTAIKGDLTILGNPPHTHTHRPMPSPAAILQGGLGRGETGHWVFLPPLSPPGGHCAEAPPPLSIGGEVTVYGGYIPSNVSPRHCPRPTSQRFSCKAFHTALGMLCLLSFKLPLF